MPRVFRPGVASAVLLGACSAGLVIASACSSSNGGGGGATGGDGGGSSSGSTSGSSGGSSGSASCTSNDALQIHFGPMYSAFITDTTNHRFQVPAVATGASGTATWSASDPTLVFNPDPTTGGTIMTLKAATPTVTITAQIGTLCGSTTLNVTSALEADWTAGSARYNNGVPVYPGCVGFRLAGQLAEAGIPLPPPPDAGCPDAGPACTGCHGPNPTGGFFKGVLHTPEQTAGFSDEALVNIFVNGTVADGGAFNPGILPYYYWNLFHTWSDIATPDEQKAMVVYLRSLEPASEEGGLDFGGLAEAGITTH